MKLELLLVTRTLFGILDRVLRIVDWIYIFFVNSQTESDFRQFNDRKKKKSLTEILNSSMNFLTETLNTAIKFPNEVKSLVVCKYFDCKFTAIFVHCARCTRSVKDLCVHLLIININTLKNLLTGDLYPAWCRMLCKALGSVLQYFPFQYYPDIDFQKRETSQPAQSACHS